MITGGLGVNASLVGGGIGEFTYILDNETLEASSITYVLLLGGTEIMELIEGNSTIMNFIQWITRIPEMLIYDSKIITTVLLDSDITEIVELRSQI